MHNVNSFYTCWLKKKMPVLIVRYENLMSDLKGQMVKILVFLNRTVSNEKLQCLSANKGDTLRRKKSSFNPYMDIDSKILTKLEQINSSIEHAILQRRTQF